MRKVLLRASLVLVVVLLLIQLVPYGRAHANPLVTGEPAWDSPRTRELAARACFDCHSNETRWPWYSQVAPLSWLVQHDVVEGRSQMNLSEWDRSHGEGDEAADVLAEGEMPPWFYLPLHGEARLSDAERAELQRGLAVTLGGESPGSRGLGGEAGDEDDD